jgi:hypothetical protein
MFVLFAQKRVEIVLAGDLSRDHRTGGLLAYLNGGVFLFVSSYVRNVQSTTLMAPGNRGRGRGDLLCRGR